MWKENRFQCVFQNQAYVSRFFKIAILEDVTVNGGILISIG